MTISRRLRIVSGTISASLHPVMFPEWHRLSPAHKKLVLAVIVGSGAWLATRKNGKAKNRSDKKSGDKKPRGFSARLSSILKICIPSWTSPEVGNLAVLTALLVGRSLLSIRVATTTGRVAQHLVEQNWKQFVQWVVRFALIGIPAAAVNSGLKYQTKMLSLRFQDRLTKRLNNDYIQGVNFYKANELPNCKIDNIDQRCTADVEKFCDQSANLYATIFKPTLDVILNTIQLSSVMGMRGPMVLFAYYMLLAGVKGKLLPNFKKLTEMESKLAGDYRSAHSRLISNAEEIAFYEGSTRERGIISTLFKHLYNHASRTASLQFSVGIVDQYLAKYGGSITGYIIMCLPVFFPLKNADRSVAGLTRDFVRNRQLLMDLGGGVGLLIGATTKIASLSGITTRVAEVLEATRRLNQVGTEPFAIRMESETKKSDDKEDEEGSTRAAVTDMSTWLEEWRARGDELRKKTEKSAHAPPMQAQGAGEIVIGGHIFLEDVTIVSPDGRLLYSGLTFEVPRGRNVMVTGPNGCGKSSLFRILGELWPPHCGVVTKPHKDDILFVPQKPYLVMGTLRDQIIYPHSVETMKQRGVTDEDLAKLLDIVDPAQSILKQWKWNDTRNWFNAFSGGQKQRVAMARVFYHRPLYAILDECTSAVSSEVEGKIYKTCATLGITLFTVSHREQLQQYHEYQLRFDGEGGWRYLSATDLATNK